MPHTYIRAAVSAVIYEVYFLNRRRRSRSKSFAFYSVLSRLSMHEAIAKERRITMSLTARFNTATKFYLRTRMNLFLRLRSIDILWLQTSSAVN
jgi:hypothetical protein